MKNKVLFIYVPFFDYHKKIEKALIENNYSVTTRYIYKYNIIYNLLLRISSRTLQEYLDFKFNRFIKSIGIERFDYIFFVQSFHLKEEFILKLKKLYPEAKFILYNWDSLKNFNYFPLIKLFDKVFSYDPVDCNNFNEIEYLPLFYSIDQNEVTKKKIDITFIGSYNHQRNEMLNSFKNFIKVNNLSSYFYVYINFRAWVKYLFSSKIITDIHFSPLEYYKMKNKINHSKAVIDMPNPINNGLTMRTFETLGSKTKLITTNQNIIGHNFYNSNNIYIIKDYKKLNTEEILFFLNKSFVYNGNLKKYSINQWVNNIFKNGS